MLNEKSVSVAQQKAAGLALAAKRGEVDPSKLEGPAKEMMKMSEKDLEDFAKTKHKGLPMKKEENNLEEVATPDRVQKVKDEYKMLKKQSIDQLRKTIGRSHKVVDLKGFNKGDAISQILRDKYGDKAVDKAFGFEEAYTTSSNPKTTDTSTNVKAYRKVFDAAMKKFNISSPSELKTDALRKKFFDYVDANYKAKNEIYEPLQEMDMKTAMKKIMGIDVKTSTSGASGFQKTMYHVNDDMQISFNDKSNLGDVYYKGKNIDSFRGVGTPDMEKVVKKYMKKYGVKTEESGQKTMTGKPWSQIRVENK